MNKEEIEDIKEDLRTLHKVLWNEHREGTYTIQRILEYINCLEQKESILDKVTDKLKEDRLIFNYLVKEKSNVIVNKSLFNHANEILNIIEGEKE